MSKKPSLVSRILSLNRKCAEIKKLARMYKTTLSVSKYLRKRQRSLTYILNDFASNKSLSEIENLEFLLGVYNLHHRSYLAISATGFFSKERAVIRESDFFPWKNLDASHFLPTEEFNHYLPSGEKHDYFAPSELSPDRQPVWLAQCRIAIIFCAVEFLRNIDRRKIKKCKECGDFYVSKTVRPSKFCSDKCRMASNNRERIASGKARDYKAQKRKEGLYQ